MSNPQVRLKVLLRERHWQTHQTFSAEYDRAARKVDPSLVGQAPSRAQLHRWTTGDVKGLPYPDHCRVLEAMFPGWTAAQLFERVNGEESVTSEPEPSVSTPDEAAPVSDEADPALWGAGSLAG
ncbi:hypothetical protein DFJ69_2240 [Thermomonospora umbrina]|uniref:Uncharacterized protein n=1 Tax=Thermomonospora umbrina TaxID=111806 RepID=A0A3D9SYU8_9ACTN|nr:hypothetical protein DFJ69_2240 [Thermomonospora umbrina]